MKRSDYRGGAPLCDVRVERADASVTLVFVRELRHPPSRVWEALTAPGALRAWAPFDADRNLGQTGSAVLRMAGGDDAASTEIQVLASEPPRRLEYTWGDDFLCWELEATAGGTRLTLRHRTAQRDHVPMFAAGWHICLDVAEAALDGRPLGRIAGKDALDHGWAELRDGYEQRIRAQA